MTFEPETLYGPCSICGAVQVGAWPHPLGEPCPQKRLIDEAYVAMLDAQRMGYIRSAGGVEEMGASFRRFIGEDDDE